MTARRNEMESLDAKTVSSLEGLERFVVDIHDHVAVVTINAPPVNAQDRLFREEIVRIMDILGLSPDVRAIVIAAKGRTFSAGTDLKERDIIEAEPGGYARHNRLVRASIDAVLECPKPVIAAVNGAAIGGGCVLALVSDILVVAEEAYLSMTEVDFGLAGGARHVLRAFSHSDGRLMILTAQRVTGPELLRMNVASRCVPGDRLIGEATSIARTIAGKAPLAVEAAKRAFVVTEEMPLRDGYRYEQTQTAALAGTEDTKEALAAFREKRSPVFHRR
jgi:enoyl-CoA hydratase/carnithine racemase